MTTNPPTAIEASIDNLVLTEGQQEALERIWEFLLNPIEQAFVLEGYSGCGKSTLVRTFLDRLPGFIKTAKLIQPKFQELEVAMTATTNKAAENLYRITGMGVTTIHSFLGLRVDTDYRTGTTTLIPRTKDLKEGYLVFIDEASYIDPQLLKMVFTRTRNCKIIFVGDPAQLTPITMTTAPVFEAGFPTAKLTQVVRQAEGNPIIDLSTMFRHTVNTGVWPTFTPDGMVIQHLSQSDFLAQIEQEFTRPDWKYLDSKILAWTNKKVIAYNHHINNMKTGSPNFQIGDYAICNSFINIGRQSVKTDQTVEIRDISHDTEALGVMGNYFELDNGVVAFMPKSLEEKNARLKKAKAEKRFGDVAIIESEWIDLRSASAQTINKSQGSTYDKVYIDLNDVARCNSGNQIARMMYVGISRARSQVFLTGDLA